MDPFAWRHGHDGPDGRHGRTYGRSGPVQAFDMGGMGGDPFAFDMGMGMGMDPFGGGMGMGMDPFGGGMGMGMGMDPFMMDPFGGGMGMMDPMGGMGMGMMDPMGGDEFGGDMAWDRWAVRWDSLMNS